MDFKLGRINLNAVAQGVGGLVFGNDNSNSTEDSYVERLLDRISNGVLAEDRRAAMTQLQTIVAESRSAQLAFGAMGFPVLMGVLREERDDVEMVRGSLETLVSALTPTDGERGPKNEVQPTLMNSDLLSREAEHIALILSLLEEEDFYVRYYTLQLLTALLTHSPNRLQEAILTIPRGITRLMDMLMDREVIRNEALLLLTYLTREAVEIQKILVFEGAFEKIFSIIKEEGGSEGGVVVQDCLELLNNLLRRSASNQILLRETMGFEHVLSILKLRGSAYNFTQQKTVNLLGALETIELLLTGGMDAEPGKESNRQSNQMVLAQKNALDHLLMLGVESPWAAVSVRCTALRCIGSLVANHPQNLNALACKVLGEEPHVEPALNSVFRIILRTSSVQEFIAADHVFKCFCEKNPNGQAMLASTIIPQPYTGSRDPLDDDIKLSFGSMLLRGLTVNETDEDLETCCRAASVLSHILKDNIQCKERVIQVQLEAPVPSFGTPELLMHRIVKYLAVAASMKNKNSNTKKNTNSSSHIYCQPIILRLLITWLADCPNAVQSFLDSRDHLTYLLELLSSPSETILTQGLSAVLLGECVLYNKSDESAKNTSMVVDAISQKIGLASYFSKFDEMQKSFPFLSAKLSLHRKPMARSSTASMSDMEESEEINETNTKLEEDPVLLSIFDSRFFKFVKKLETDIRESIVDAYSHPKSKVAVVPTDMEQKNGESNDDYIVRLKSFVQKQCKEIQDLLARNATLAEDVAKTGGSGVSSGTEQPNGGRERVQIETLRRDLEQANQHIESLKSEKRNLEQEVSKYQHHAEKADAELRGLSEAYVSLETVNARLREEGKGKNNDDEEEEEGDESYITDLLECLGVEQSKVSKLKERLEELGVDTDALLREFAQAEDETGGDENGSEENGSEEEDSDNKDKS
ncbi:hypothetical protein ACHQM5_027836 [Ranunculus cassubicifolius]